MNKIANYLVLTTALASMSLLGGCVSPGKDMIPPGGDMTMTQIYRQETGIGASAKMSAQAKGQNDLQPTRANAFSDTTDSSGEATSPASMTQVMINKSVQPDYVAYTQTASNEVNSLFKPLPNPEIPIYIYPHLVSSNGESYPKPGMTTTFFLYRSNHYAMPGETY